MRTPRPTISPCLCGLALLLSTSFGAACKTSPAETAPGGLTVYAASSLTEAFTELSQAFAKADGGAPPRLSFAGSQILRLQIEQGAEADVFASANPEHIRTLVDAGRMEEPRTFAYNELVLVVPEHNPAGITSFAELPKARRIVIGAPDVPVGIYTRRLFERAAAAWGPDFVSAVRSHIVSEEHNVRLVRAKVELGEADAAVVYRTDASARVRTLEIPSELSVRVEYEIGLVGTEPHRQAARRWIAFVTSDEGRRILAEHGFVTP